MASIHRETVVDVGVEQAWAALRTVGAAHELFAPVLTDGQLNGETRRVRFANGMVVNERIVDVDDGMRRVAYSVLDAPGLRYHHASMQVLEEGPNRCRFVWITDFLPADAGGSLTPLIEAGSTALKTNLEAGKPITAATSWRERRLPAPIRTGLPLPRRVHGSTTRSEVWTPAHATCQKGVVWARCFSVRWSSSACCSWAAPPARPL